MTAELRQLWHSSRVSMCYHLDGPIGGSSQDLHQCPQNFCQTHPSLGVWREGTGKGLGIYYSH